jgi:hypothetical protein
MNQLQWRLILLVATLAVAAALSVGVSWAAHTAETRCWYPHPDCGDREWLKGD